MKMNYQKILSYRISLPSWTPAESRIYFTAVSLLVSWRFLSNDYFALAQMRLGPDISWGSVSSLLEALSWSYPVIFSSTDSIAIYQILFATLVILGAVSAQRAIWSIGFLGLLAFEGQALHFRTITFDFELCYAVLSLYFLWPYKWTKLFNSDNEARGGARDIKVILALYVSLMYFWTGYSKAALGITWPVDAKIEHFYWAQKNYFSVVYPTWLAPYSALLQRVMLSSVTLTATLNTFAALVELLYPLVLFTPLARRYLPPLGFLFHFGVFVMFGTYFYMLALTAFLLFVPWSHLAKIFKQKSLTLTVPPALSLSELNQRDLATKALACIFVILICLPPLKGIQMSPFINYKVFGFDYTFLDKKIVFYRLGFKDQQGKRIPFQFHYGGFMDYAQVYHAEYSLKGLVEADTKEKAEKYYGDLVQYQASVRPCYSTRWLLGPLTIPDHMTTAVPLVYSTDLMKNLRILKFTHYRVDHPPTQEISYPAYTLEELYEKKISELSQEII